MNYKLLVKKITVIVLPIVSLAFLTPTVHAQTLTNTISSTLQNVVAASKQNGLNDGILRNQIIINNSTNTRNKEKILVNELNSELLILEDIQTRIIEKTAEAEASSTDITSVNTWLASSSADILLAQNNIFFFSSEINNASSTPISQDSLVKARRLADTAIDSVNTTHNDLQSALNALTNIL